MKLDPKLDRQLLQLAPKLQDASPTTSSAVLAIVKSIVLPILPGIVATLLVKASAKTKRILRATRDVLNEAELDEV
jgi:hypothetical protein